MLFEFAKGNQIQGHNIEVEGGEKGGKNERAISWAWNLDIDSNG